MSIPHVANNDTLELPDIRQFAALAGSPGDSSQDVRTGQWDARLVHVSLDDGRLLLQRVVEQRGKRGACHNVDIW